ncbi:M10 family metallopeptidase C-terminal domain-containing protein [Sphingomonas rhizophila]|uniref:M10 family metallopeptidase C-terminal domain-containing protein n=1 Tax=Sphingomonas rhizophila TaxID=2071607 RepID=A0A7G9S9W3_9SPHN|nr:M10 family metallopeptidase C-terminal domain-containing protein [Sphingomonas rhizophila]QNN64638.1 M10 family metallopeptidase C-terminal domain-containing protein [Sphingomonas rhizophila]
MPQLFTLPGPPGTANNFLAEYFLSSGEDYVVASTTSSYAAIARMFWADHNVTSFTNHGTLWNRSAENVTSILVGFNLPTVTNTGTMVAEATNGNAYGVSVASRGDLVSNSGSIYAIANGNAQAVEHWDPAARIQNSGLIVAYAPAASTGNAGGVGAATAVALFNGGDLQNDAGGSILAEGISATAVIYSRGSLLGDTLIANHGRIEALATGGAPSYGILAGGLEVETLNFVNSGLLRADIAWSSFSTDTMYGPRGSDRITNTSSGQIFGRVETGGGKDTLVNQGAIQGDIALGDENDVLDTSGGSIVGVIDLGWHDDQLNGSAGSDRATGNRGNDHLNGNGGNDLLLGGTGADFLIGGSGNDGLYGEGGSDHIISRGADVVRAGEQNDLVEAEDLSFALLAGDGGYDTLSFNVGAMKLDLKAALATGRLTGFENILLNADQAVLVRAGDAQTLGGGKLNFEGQGSSHIALVGAWSEAASITRDGATIRVFVLGSETVYAPFGLSISVGAAAPAGYSGLGSIASGAAALAPGGATGLALTDPVRTGTVALEHDLFIDDGEVFRADDANVLTATNHSIDALINNGVVALSTSTPYITSRAITGTIESISNSGSVSSIGSGGGFAYAIEVRGNLANTGEIICQAISGDAYAVTLTYLRGDKVFENSGVISAKSVTGMSHAINIGGGPQRPTAPIAENHGTIEAIGGSGTYAVRLNAGGTFVNSGSISASHGEGSAANDAVAVILLTTSPWATVNSFVNSGIVSGVVAIQSTAGRSEIINSGSISGSVRLGQLSDAIYNSGSISGNVALGAGSDLYRGTDATALIDVEGGLGADMLIGGAFADGLTGGEGNDLVAGGYGADQLFGGAGSDRFIFLSANDSIGSASDLIQDFETGIDRIDLSALATTSVNLATANGVTTITAQSASGTTVIRVAGSVNSSDIDVAPKGSTIIGTSNDDALLATVGVTRLNGGGGDDLLVGGLANDRLDGGAGTDTMVGGKGNDTYVINTPDDVVVERPGEGVDQVLLNGLNGDYEMAANVENATLMTAGQVRGNELDNVLVGSTGTDVLTGMDGDDILIGGLGADYLGGAQGADLYVYNDVLESTEAAQDRVALETGVDKIDLSALDVRSISWTHVRIPFELPYVTVTIATSTGTMTLRVTLPLGVTDLTMSDFILAPVGDVLGTDGDDNLAGGFGSDHLFGLSGNDTLTGKGGDDILEGGRGDDQINGGDGSDSASYITADYGVRVNLGLQTAQDTVGAGADWLVDVENLIGSAFDDVLRGDALGNSLDGGSGADRLDGLGGDDLLIGGAGDDLLLAGAGNDQLVGGAGYDRMYGGLGDDTYVVADADDYAYENAGEGRDRALASLDYQLRDNVEDLTLTGTAVIGKGNALYNVLVGNAVGNRLYGYEGDDALDGGAGDDYLLGAEGADTLTGGSGYDRMYGGTGDDRYIVSDLADYAYENAGEGTDRVVASINHQLRGNIEELELSGSGNTRGFGNELANLVLGNSGANLLYGRGGDDQLRGEAGNDILYGESGADALSGGSGLDRFYGGGGADLFAFSSGDFAGMSSGTADRIHDFNRLQADRLDFTAVDSNAQTNGDQAFSFIGSAAFNGVTGELRYQQISGNTYIQGDTDGDGKADFWVRLDGLHALSSGTSCCDWAPGRGLAIPATQVAPAGNFDSGSAPWRWGDLSGLMSAFDPNRTLALWETAALRSSYQKEFAAAAET